MSTTTRKQPEWVIPENTKTPVLMINNSMTCRKTEFIPSSGRLVSWYICGPTVYAPTHLGHARTYLSFDITRRIMENYFNYDVKFIMNITDIDDKIIITSRQAYLFSEKLNNTAELSASLIEELEQALAEFLTNPATLGKWLPPGDTTAERWNALLTVIKNGGAPSPTDVPKFEMWIKMATKSFNSLEKARGLLANGELSQEYAHLLLEDNRDTLCPYLDQRLKHTVTDHSIFRDFASFWEKEYFKDMDALGIMRPEILTRVSEYVPEIIGFVEKIIKNGYAYVTADGSVYFDTVRFDSSEHFYAKLEPWSASNLKLLQEGEGDLTSAAPELKKNAADFALWKASKAGEPSWQSPWGLGRPGWHIECSAMCGDVAGEKLDIHGGGVDLKFPHHDNEIAQSESHYNYKQWVNYFMHTGHLHIEGQKMSKSLKNFFTVQETLEKFSATQIRIMVLLHSWDSLLDFKESTLHEAKVFEAAINNFTTNVKAFSQEVLSSPEVFTGSHNYHEREKDLIALLESKQSVIHAALCDNFDTSTAMNTIRDLITASNAYWKEAGPKKASHVALSKVARYVTKIMRVFGVFPDANPDIGSAAVGGTAGSGSVEETAGPYVRLLASFRDKVRDLARKKADYTEFLKVTDQLRDEELVELNVALDDRDDGRALVKFVDRDTILRQREEKRRAHEQMMKEKEEKRRIEAAKEAEKLAKGATPPTEMFKDEEGRKLYAKWDEKGLPTHKADGEEISKSGYKKLQKQWEAQEKLHEKFLAASKPK